MPKKYHVKIRALPPRFEPISEYCSIEINKCLHCKDCVKDTACVYNVYDKRGFDPVQIVDTLDTQCMSCMRCVQECKANILSRTRNARFDAMGDEYWRPDIIRRIWAQAETGKIPVSGAGYRGPFAGPGFDQMWTDMSEIVRPTRDGIHGREYISTVVELGGRPDRLEFDETDRPVTEFPPFVGIPLPVVFDLPPDGVHFEAVRESIAEAAGNLGTLAVADLEEARGRLSRLCPNMIVRLGADAGTTKIPDEARVVELAYGDDVMETAGAVKRRSPKTVISIRVPLDEQAADRVSHLAAAGAEVIHLRAGRHGRGMGARSCDFITRLVREVHLRLVEESIRDRVTLLASGGIAMAEHVAKTIICGADGVGVDLVLLVALECRLCRECGNGASCPVRLDEIDPAYGAQRIVNLMGSWHSQLIEVMGAMGMREVRRLRGEVGRAMFFDDLERESFAPLFGERRAPTLSTGNPGVDAAVRPIAPERPAPAERGWWAYPPAEGLIDLCRSRFRNRLCKYRVVRMSACVSCGKCSEVCQHGVHIKAGDIMIPPRSHLCVGPDTCKAEGAYCVEACPHNALRLVPDPAWGTFGDPRWTPDLILSTWMQAETGRPPDNGLEYRVGASGGGFDRIDFKFPEEPPDPVLKPEEVDLSVPLNRRSDDDSPRIDIGFPVYGGGMSFGAISLPTMVGRARAYRAFGSFTCTGEGGYPAELVPYAENVITQVATGLFGVSEETIRRAPVVEFKYAQGAKPGLGGHLLGDKVTAAVARIRESVEGNALFSPFPFHSVYSVEDHKKHVDWIKAISPRALVSVKVSSPTDVDMVAVGSYYAGAHIIHIDGSYGGTGAAPDIAKKNIAMPIEYAIPRVHQFLMAEGIRDQIALVISGGVRTAWDIAKSIALGADCVVIATSEMVALECIRCGRCESGRGCPRGIATTDPELSSAFGTEWATQRIINLFNSYCIQLQEILWRLGMRSIRDLVGRTDVLVHLDYVDQAASTTRYASAR